MAEPFWQRVPTPCFVVDLGRLRANAAALASVRDRAGCRVLLSLKAFALARTFPLLREALAGTSCASPDEARLGREHFGGEVHVCAPAYAKADLDGLLDLADTIVFNSHAQWRRFGDRVRGAARPIACGLRVNPRVSTVAVPLYDPCAPHSRLGIVPEAFDRGDLEGITGLHVHALCEQNADALAQVLAGVEAHFGDVLQRMDWLNLGGGHHLTRPDYDVDRLVELVTTVRGRYGVDVILEPGEAVALGAGVLVATVLDVVESGMPVAILDTSAEAHMPDVLAMPYRPEVEGAGLPGTRPHTVRLGGLTCLAGDVIGDYAFDAPLRPGDRVVLRDMAHYTMVKTTTFNGVRLPSIALYDPEADTVEVVRRFDYTDYASRLG